MKTPVFPLALICFSICLLVSSRALAATLYVDSEVPSPGDGTSWETAFKTMQEGIDVASDGETVIVAQGTYVENIRLNGKNITLRSTDPLDPAVVANTVIDGNQAGSVVTFSGAEDETCVLSGFTIRNGNGLNGGGISGAKEWGRGARALLENNLIVDNTALRGGGIAYCDGIIRNNTISRNRVTERQYEGGGVHGCNGLIEQNFVTDNTAGWRGGGLSFCCGTIQENVIARNSASGGGGLSVCNMTIARNVICDNVATEGDGGGLAGCRGLIENNLIVGNTAELVGGGLSTCGDSSSPALVQNNVICGNSAGYAGGGLARCVGTIQNCIIWSNESPEGPQVAPPIGPGDSLPVYSCIQGWTSGGEGNMSDDPGFIDAGGIDGDPKTHDGDYHLLPQSPCIDAGKNDEGSWDAVDLDGQRRVFYGISSMSVDMGAYEFRSISPEPTVWYVDAAAPLSDDGRTPVTALRSIREGIQVAWEGDEVIAAEGIYLENVQFRGKNIILRSTDPLASDVVADTIVDGNQAGSAVTFAGAEDETCILAGFTIRNGKAESGGGICGGTDDHRSRPIIRNNVIMNNTSETWGGGGIAYCDGAIEHNLIIQNWAVKDPVHLWPRRGGGVYSCDGVIRHNRISHNFAEGLGGGLAHCDGVIRNNTINLNGAVGGGGLFACLGTIKDNVISHNEASGNGGGLVSCNGTILNNMVIRNNADGKGGGMSECDASLYNNVICRNKAGGDGAGLFDCDGEKANNTICDNVAEGYWGGLGECQGTIVNCIIWGNDARDGAQMQGWNEPTYSCIEKWTGEGVGNIEADPSFADTYYHLSDQSPCIDVGDNAAAPPLGLDMGGNLRIAFGKSSFTTDMGAWEYGSVPFAVTSIVENEGGGLKLRWACLPYHRYIIWSCSDVANGQWLEEGRVRTREPSTEWVDPTALPTRKFYRIEMGQQ